jgi:hypothetical protein
MGSQGGEDTWQGSSWWARQSHICMWINWEEQLGSKTDPHLDEKLNWIRQWIEWQRDLTAPREFLESFQTDINLKKLHVILGQEQRAGAENNQKTIDYFSKKYQGVFGDLIFTEHPPNISGETAGKHSNERFAAQYFKKYFIDTGKNQIAKNIKVSDFSRCANDLRSLYPETNANTIEFIWSSYAEIGKDPRTLSAHMEVRPKKSLEELKEGEIASKFTDTLHMFPTYLEALNADFDGDTVSVQGVWTKNSGSRDYIYSKTNIINIGGGTMRGTKDITAHTLYALTRGYND